MGEARVEYDYDAENADELTLRTGDIITNVVQKDGGWWEGKLKGKQGVFPDNFVKVLVKDQNKTSGCGENKSNGIPLRRDRKRKCRVVYSYTPVNDDELELEVNTVIDVLEEVEEGWWKGILNGRIGVFPSNFVEELNERTSALTAASCVGIHGSGGSSIPNVRTSKTGDNLLSDSIDGLSQEIKPKPVRGVGLGNIFQDEVIRLKPTQDSPPERKTSQSPVPKKPPLPSYTASCTDAPMLPPKPVREQARVVFAYEACNDDELSLKEGDIISIITKDVEDRGWWKGELNNRVGVFPDNFIEIIPVAEPGKLPRKPDRTTMSGISESNERNSDALPPIPDHPKRPYPELMKKVPALGPDDKPERPEKRVPPTPGKKPQLPPPMKKPQRIPVSVPSSEALTDDMKDELGLDGVEASTDKLTHLTATRPRNPHHRPPSHLFLKENPPVSKEKLSDLYETEGKGEITDNEPPLAISLHETPSVNDVNQEPIFDVTEDADTKLRPLDRPASPVREVDSKNHLPFSQVQVLHYTQPSAIPTKKDVLGVIGPDKSTVPLWPPPKPDSEGCPSSPPKLKHYSYTSKSNLTPSLRDDAGNRVPSKNSCDDATTTVVVELKKEVATLKSKVLELQLMMESHRAQYTDKVKELTNEIDEEKKTRLMMQVELDRLKRQLKDH